MHRFFIPGSWIRGSKVSVSGPQAHQIARVLRMHPGDQVIVLDNSGWEIDTELTTVEPHLVEGEVLRRRLPGTEARTKISLHQSVLKSHGFEFVLQKGTELGIVEFVPLVAERCVMRDLEDAEHKRRRWASIIQESAEQSHRGRMPVLRAATLFPPACELAMHSRGLSLIAWEAEGLLPLQSVLRTAPANWNRSWPPLTINLFIGPEGGFAVSEIDLARRYGLVPVTLGPRILRAETAGIVAAAAILYELGDMQ